MKRERLRSARILDQRTARQIEYGGFIVELVDDQDGIRVKVRSSEMLWMKWGDRGFIGIQDGRLLITYPQSIGIPVSMFVKVKKVLRNDPITIRVESGLWNYGSITLTFDSKEDADKIEPQLLKLVSK